MNDDAKQPQFEDGAPKEEMDEPFSEDIDEVGDILSARKIDIEEKDKDRRERRYFTAFKLIVGCLAFLGAIYVIDVGMSAFLNKELSGITSDIVEIIKTLLFTLSGYLFARKENGD